ncbi:MAG: NYN domain-containing protein [Chloroflexi bacterium]|nr:NYN domain-containing protein [Chloroflexota bacterium]
MSADRADTPAAGEGTRRRGTRGGRGRQRASDAPESGETLNDPRIAGRRPARPSKAEAEAESSSAAETKAAPKRRSRARAAPKEAPAEDKAEATAEAEAEPKKRAPRRRRAAAAAEEAAPEPATAEAEPEKKAAPRRRASTRKSSAASNDDAQGAAALAEEVRALREALTAQSQALEALREMQDRAVRRLRLGVFVDVPNLIYGAERGEGAPDGASVDMGKLLAYLSEGRELIRATAYSPVSDDPGEPVERQRFVEPFVRHDYRIVTKPMKRFQDGSVKGNFDVEMALDMVTMADRLDVVSIVSGDADFARAVEVLQTQGVRVEVIAFSGSTSIEMRALADEYIDVATILDRVGA